VKTSPLGPSICFTERHIFSSICFNERQLFQRKATFSPQRGYFLRDVIFCQAYVSMKDNVFARVCERCLQYLCFSSVQDTSVSRFIPVIFFFVHPKYLLLWCFFRLFLRDVIFCQAFVSRKDNVFARVCERWLRYLCFLSVQDTLVSRFIPVIFSSYISKIYYCVVLLGFFLKDVIFCQTFVSMKNNVFARVCERWL